MISLDIETSGLDSGRCGIWQIGAIEIENPKNQFLQESKIDDEDFVSEEALKVIGKTEEELRDANKQSQKQMILNFIKWIGSCETRITLGHNIGFDVYFILNKALRYEISEDYRKVLGYKSIDLHTIAQLVYLNKNRNYFLDENNKSNFNLSKILEYCGIQDTRRKVENNKIIQKGSSHNALEDAKLTAECFSRLVLGENLFPEFKRFPIPKELIK